MRPRVWSRFALECRLGLAGDCFTGCMLCVGGDFSLGFMEDNFRRSREAFGLILIDETMAAIKV